MELSAFVQRHIGPTPAEQQTMLRDLGLADLESLVRQVVPEAIRLGVMYAAPVIPSHWLCSPFAGFGLGDLPFRLRPLLAELA